MFSKNNFLMRLCLTIGVILLLHQASDAQKKSTKPAKGYGEASYSLSANGQYMSAWLVAGPMKMDTAAGLPSEDKQKKFFEEPIPSIVVSPKKAVDPLTYSGKSYNWELARATNDVVDLDARFSKAEFVSALAMAEIISDREMKSFLSVGSDDGVRIWHNGKLIHDHWIPRGVNKDDDLVPITLVPGSNQIILKVQDIRQGWGFVVRVLDIKGISDHLITAVERGDLDQINQLIEGGADINQKNASGITPLNQARIQGREDVAALLLTKGAKESPLPAFDAMVTGLYSQLEGKQASGVAVLVSQNGKVLYEKGFGYADIEKKQLIQPNTKFRIGSITKQFTAAGILKLQEEGKISVNDKLSKFLPDFPRANEITVHQLLTHISGIHSFTGKPEFIKRVTVPITENELIDFFKNDPYDFNPGERWQYNNSAYFLLGYIIGKVSGKPYAQYVKETFFDPLGMTNTGVHSTGINLTDEAKGYTKENGQYKLAENWDMSWAGGAGALYSTVKDLYTWNEALFSGKVLSEKSMKDAFTPVVLGNGKKPDNANYGYGWALDDYRGEDIIEHGGGLVGFISQLARYPEENVTVVILTNITPTEVNLNSNKIAEFLLWEKMEKQKPRSVNASVTEDVTPYVGRYDFQNVGVMVITAENNSLFAKLGGQPRFPIFPSGEGEYFWKVVDARIRFVKNEKGEVVYGDFEQNGNKIRVPRLKEETIVSINKDLYSQYAGKYNLGNNMIVTVTREEDKLFAQVTNQPRFEILPLSETEFTVREVNARVTFVKETDGKVTKFILDQGGQKIDVARIE